MISSEYFLNNDVIDFGLMNLTTFMNDTDKTELQTKNLFGNIIPKNCLCILYLCDFDGKKLTITHVRMYDNEYDGLEAYANTPNPASQLMSGQTHEKLLEEHKAFVDRMDTEEFIEMLKQSI